MFHHTLAGHGLADLINPDPIFGIARGIHDCDRDGGPRSDGDRRGSPIELERLCSGGLRRCGRSIGI